MAQGQFISTFPPLNFSFDGVSIFPMDGADHHHPEPTPEGLISPRQYFLFMVCNIFLRTSISIGGIVGNFLTIRTFIRIGLDDNVTITFFWLAISDFAVLVADLVICGADICETIESQLGPGLIFEFPPALVDDIFLRLESTFGYITASLTFFLAVQRALCVAMPFRFKGVFNRRRTYVIIAVTWLYWLMCGSLHCSPLRYRRTTDPLTNSSTIVIDEKPFSGKIMLFLWSVNSIAFNAVSQTAVVLGVLVMARALKKSVRFRQKAASSVSGNSSSVPKADKGVGDFDEAKKEKSLSSKSEGLANSKERQAIIQVALVSSLLLLSNTPRSSLVISMMIVPGLRTGGLYQTTFLVCAAITGTFKALNSSLNFLIYYKYNKKFREACFKKN